MLRAGDAARLTLVSAPAGSGKTTLVAQWQASPDELRPFAWLCLDEQDNDPVRFWDGVIASLARTVPGTGARAQAALRARGDERHRRGAAAADQRAGRARCGRGPRARRPSRDRRPGDPPCAGVPRRPRSCRASRHGHDAGRPAVAAGAPARARGRLLEIRAGDLRFSDADADAMLAGLGLELAAVELSSSRRTRRAGQQACSSPPCRCAGGAPPPNGSRYSAPPARTSSST